MITGDRLLLLAKRPERKTEVAMRFSIIGFKAEGLGDPIDGSVVLPHLVSNHAQ